MRNKFLLFISLQPMIFCDGSVNRLRVRSRSPCECTCVHVLCTHVQAPAEGDALITDLARVRLKPPFEAHWRLCPPRTRCRVVSPSHDPSTQRAVLSPDGGHKRTSLSWPAPPSVTGRSGACPALTEGKHLLSGEPRMTVPPPRGSPTRLYL